MMTRTQLEKALFKARPLSVRSSHQIFKDCEITTQSQVNGILRDF